jgi:topoisomerase-4 subunit A
LKNNPVVEYAMRVSRKKMNGEFNLEEFIEIKGWKAIGNKFSDTKLYDIALIKFDEVIIEDAKENDGENGDTESEEKTLFD